jgi:MFS family permease
VGPVVAGVLIAADDLLSTTTRAMLAAGVLTLVATAFAAVSDRRGRGTVTRQELAREGVRAILGTPGVPAAVFASIAVLSAADIFTAYLPVLGQQRGIDPGVVGVLLALRAAASLASRIGIGALVRRVGRVRLMWASAAVGAAAFAGMTSTEAVLALAALSLIAGFALGFGQPLSMTMVVQLVPVRARATALGIRLTGNRVGQVAGPAAAGIVAGSAGASSVFWLTSGILLVSAVAIGHHLGGTDRPEVDAAAVASAEDAA